MIRNRSIRTKLTLLALAPVAVMILLGAGVVGPALDDLDDAERSADIATVVLASMEYRDTVEHERFATLDHIENGGQSGPLTELRAETDAERQLLLDLVASSPLRSDAAVSGDMARLAEAANGLLDLRVAVDDGTITSAAEADAQFVDLLQVQQDFNRILRTAGDAELVRRGDAIEAYYDAEEALSDLGSFVGSRLDGHGLDTRALQEAFALEELEELEFDRFKAVGQPAEVELLEAALTSDEHELFESLLHNVIENGTEHTVSAAEWWPATRVMFDTANEVEDIVYDRFVERAEEASAEARSTALTYGIGSAVVALFAVAAAFLLGRSLARRVRRLSDEAHAAAVEHLPVVLASVTDDDTDSIADELPDITADGEDEIGQLAESFNTVLRTAVETSVDHVQKRAATMTNILVSLGRRNQALIDRQLNVLDDLESQVDDPAVLEGLFRVDHMLTRLRRNSENLLVLASDRPGRQWTEPVPLLDVVRGATSEVENLERVDIDLEAFAGRPIAGPFAIDLSHVVAELIDNALSYSPPSYPVALRAADNRGQVRLWIIDRGVGMSDAEITAANTLITEPTGIADVVADQVGFQVVGRLARRLGLHVALHGNPGGGLAASIDIPIDAFAQPEPPAAPEAFPQVDLAPMGEMLEAPSPEPTTQVAETAPAVSAMTPAEEPVGDVWDAVTGGTPAQSIAASAPVDAAPATDAALTAPEAPASVDQSAGFRKRVPGQAIAGSNHGMAPEDAGLQRLGSAEPAAAAADPFAEAERRRRAFSGLQAGVAMGRAQDGESTAPSPAHAPAQAPAPTDGADSGAIGETF